MLGFADYIRESLLVASSTMFSWLCISRFIFHHSVIDLGPPRFPIPIPTSPPVKSITRQSRFRPSNLVWIPVLLVGNNILTHDKPMNKSIWFQVSIKIRNLHIKALIPNHDFQKYRISASKGLF